MGIKYTYVKYTTMNQLLNKISTNWKSGLTVSLVSIPLSVSLAVASQTSPVMGIITAFWAGLMASFFGGSHYNIVGPTGALSGILATYAIINGAHTLPVLAILSGFFILIAFFFRLEKYLVYIPASAIHGFTLGVAFIIGLNQLNSALGLNGLKTHERFIENVLESLTHLPSTSLPTFLIFLLFLSSLFIFQKFLPKLPGAIILTPLGILLGYLSTNNFVPLTLTTLGSKYPDISPVLFNLPKLTFSPSMITTALTVAVVAILETMISAKIADGMTQTKHNRKKEMLGLGLANLVSGVAGGMPATAALARTSLNIKAGANSQLSATISSLSILVISFIFLTYFKFIPMAIIAAILVFVAIRMVESHHFHRMIEVDKKSFFLSLIVAIITIVEDPIVGILFGAAVSLILFLDQLSKGQFELVVNQKTKRATSHIAGHKIDEINKDAHTIVYTIKGQLVYINGESHLSRFENLPDANENVILRLRELHFIDLDGVDVLNELIDLLESQNKQVYLTGVNELIYPMIKHSKKYLSLEQKDHVFEKTRDVLTKLGYKL